MAVFSSAFQERRTHQVNAAAAEVQIVCPSVVPGHCLQGKSLNHLKLYFMWTAFTKSL